MTSRLIDRAIMEIDAGLRTLFAHPQASRPLPAGPATATESPLEASAQAESIRLMRVNHCGEVCAQALYQGQAFVARDTRTRKLLESAAEEERDHLAWCAQRLDQLGGSTSRLAPAFYAGSFALGAVSGMLGDRWSMGFLVETERQVEAHLDGHLAQISPADTKSRAILETMREDEIRHGNSAASRGAATVPPMVQKAMRAFSVVMTRSTYRV